MRLYIKEKLFELPQEIGDGRLDLLLEIFQYIWSSDQSKALVLDFSKTLSITPSGLAIMACLADCLRENSIVCRVQKLSDKIPSYSFLSAILFNVPSGKTQLRPIQEMAINLKDQILQGVSLAIAPGFLDKVDEKFNQYLSEDELWHVRFILNELMQNAKDHSTSERYYLYAGLEQGDFQFGVCDMGVTIPAKLEQKYSCTDDLEYLKKSLVSGVGTRRERSGGLGLSHMVEILRSQKGRLVIMSRKAQIRLYFERRKTEGSFLKYPLRGTWCMARLTKVKK